MRTLTTRWQQTVWELLRWTMWGRLLSVRGGPTKKQKSASSKWVE